jgi:hypothetical protein
MTEIDDTNNATDGAKPRQRKRTPLKTAENVRAELARLYRQARAGSIEVGDASKLGNLLQVLGRMIETSDLEKRLEKLEEKNG